MFSSNPNPNANPSSSCYQLHCGPLFAGYENSGVLLNHHQLLDPFTAGFILPAAANHQSLTNTAFTGNGNSSAVMSAAHYAHTSNFIHNKKTVKRDRHSKICTAQGLRDRRVRLSIDIAREFFDLQDMLGFDKASKTLEWLLNKSRMAIKELAEMKNNGNDGELDEATTKQMEGISEERRIMEKLIKESRDKARARARQRTREKLCKKFADTSQFRSLSQIKLANCEESSSYVFAHDHHQVQEPCSQAPTERKQKYPSSNFAYELQNLEIPKDFNWDIISSMPHQYSTFRAITKHESFKW